MPLSEQTALATAVIDLRVMIPNIDLLQGTGRGVHKSLRVVSNQGTAGTAPSDVVRAHPIGEHTVSLIALGVARAQNAHAIVVLVGKNPEDLDIPLATMPVPSVPGGRALGVAAARRRDVPSPRADGRAECRDPYGRGHVRMR